MTDAERAEVLVTARMLEAAGKLDLLSTGLTVVAAFAIFTSDTRIPFLIVAFGLVAKFYAMRIAFDARLLADVATGTLATPDLDHALIALSLAPAAKAGRDWSTRCRGAKRLIVLCALATMIQLVTLLAVPMF